MRIFYFASIELGKANAANRHVLELCKAMTKRGHQFRVFVPKVERQLDEDSDNVNIRSVPSLNGKGRFLRNLTFFFFLPWVAFKDWMKWKPDYIYVRFMYLSWIAMLPLRLLTPIITVAELNGIRSLDIERGKLGKRIIRFQEYISLKLYHKVIGVSPELCYWAHDTSGILMENTASIGNGVPIDRFLPTTREEAQKYLGLNDQIHYIIFVGSFYPWHDTATLINSIPKIVESYSGRVKLLMVGDGEEREELISLAQELGVDDNICWTGRVDSQFVPYYINAADVCAALFPPGRHYFSPLKVYEYMSCSRPFVSTRLGASFDQELEKYNCGIFVSPNDHIEMAHAVIRLLNDPALGKAMGERGREVAASNYSWDIIAAKTEKFLLRF